MTRSSRNRFIVLDYFFLISFFSIVCVICISIAKVITFFQFCKKIQYYFQFIFHLLSYSPLSHYHPPPTVNPPFIVGGKYDDNTIIIPLYYHYNTIIIP